MLLLRLSRFSPVQLRATPQMAVHQAPLSLGFSMQEHWSGLPFPSPMNESEKWKWSHSVVSTLRDLMDCSLPGSSFHGIFQATVLEWVAIAFSKCVLTRFSCFWVFATLWTIASQAPLSMGFSRQECWNGLLCPLPGKIWYTQLNLNFRLKIIIIIIIFTVCLFPWLL